MFHLYDFYSGLCELLPFMKMDMSLVKIPVKDPFGKDQKSSRILKDPQGFPKDSLGSCQDL